MTTVDLGIVLRHLFNDTVTLRQWTDVIASGEFGSVTRTSIDYSITVHMNPVTYEETMWLPSGGLQIGDARIVMFTTYTVGGVTVTPVEGDYVVYDSIIYEITKTSKKTSWNYTIMEAYCRRREA